MEFKYLARLTLPSELVFQLGNPFLQRLTLLHGKNRLSQRYTLLCLNTVLTNLSDNRTNATPSERVFDFL